MRECVHGIILCVSWQSARNELISKQFKSCFPRHLWSSFPSLSSPNHPIYPRDQGSRCPQAPRRPRSPKQPGRRDPQRYPDASSAGKSQRRSTLVIIRAFSAGGSNYKNRKQLQRNYLLGDYYLEVEFADLKDYNEEAAIRAMSNPARSSGTPASTKMSSLPLEHESALRGFSFSYAAIAVLLVLVMPYWLPCSIMSTRNRVFFAWIAVEGIVQAVCGCRKGVWPIGVSIFSSFVIACVSCAYAFFPGLERLPDKECPDDINEESFINVTVAMAITINFIVRVVTTVASIVYLVYLLKLVENETVSPPVNPQASQGTRRTPRQNNSRNVAQRRR